MGNDGWEVNRKAITKQLTWAQAAEIRGVSSRHMRRIRWVVEQHGLVAVMAKAAGGPGASGFWPAPSSYCAGSATIFPSIAASNRRQRLSRLQRIIPIVRSALTSFINLG